MTAAADSLIAGLARLSASLGIPSADSGTARAVLARRIVAALLLVYTVSFALFYPQIATNVDEKKYLQQTELMLQGRSSIELVEPLSGELVIEHPSTYSAGTALSMALPVWLAGRRGGFVIPCLALVLCVLGTVRWLEDEERSPLFAVAILSFIPCLVMGRVAMSDMPSGAIAALGLWLFWRGQSRRWMWWLASGFVAGASLIFRATNPLVFAPLFAGAMLRRDRNWMALLAGGLAGTALRPITMKIFFGSAIFERSNYHYSPETIGERLPLFLFGLLVLVPCGMAAAAAYRGRRRPEIIATVFLFFLFFLFQEFSTIETGAMKRLILGLRYFIPVLPVMCFAMAESIPRLWKMRLEGLRPEAARIASASMGLVLVIWITGVGIASAAVHPFFANWSNSQARIRNAIHENVPLDAVIVTNEAATLKFFPVLQQKYRPVSRRNIDASEVDRLAEQFPKVFLVILDRTDSDFFRENRDENAAFVAAISRPLHSLYNEGLSPTDHLRIWRVESP